MNLRAYYWYNSSTYSPIKIHSALLRLSKNALLEGGIELPDPAREVIFPKGIPLVQQTENPQLPSKPAKEALAGTKEDGDSITTGEGDLKSDAAEVSKQSQGSVPEATENFLDPPPKGKAATS